MNAPAAKIRGLEVWHGQRSIVRIDELTIAKGEIVTILGPNGAGKSTLLRCLLGVQSHMRGEVCVLGQHFGRGATGMTRLRRRIGYLPQILPSHSELPLTVREVVAIGRTGAAGLLRPLRRDDWWIVDEWIERLGLAEVASRSFGQISGGEQRKTVIARAMAQQPELLLLDEPTANLDLGWRERIVQTIHELYARTRCTVVLVCHELEVLPPCCRRVVLLQRGRLLADAEAGDVLTTDVIGEIYGPNLRVIESQGRWAVIPGAAVDVD